MEPAGESAYVTEMAVTIKDPLFAVVVPPGDVNVITILPVFPAISSNAKEYMAPLAPAVVCELPIASPPTVHDAVIVFALLRLALIVTFLMYFVENVVEVKVMVLDVLPQVQLTQPFGILSEVHSMLLSAVVIVVL